MVTTAESVQIIEKLITTLAPGKMPVSDGGNAGGMQWADIEKAMFAKDETGRLKRSTDKAYNAQVEKMIADFNGEEVGHIVMHPQ